MTTIKPDKMLLLSNAIIQKEMDINSLEQSRIDILKTGDPKIDDGQLARLNQLGKEIWGLKRELAEKTTQLRRMKSAYYQEIIRNTVFVKDK